MDPTLLKLWRNRIYENIFSEPVLCVVMTIWARSVSCEDAKVSDDTAKLFGFPNDDIIY